MDTDRIERETLIAASLERVWEVLTHPGSWIGEADPAGYELRVTQMAVADELAAAAELAQGKLDRTPVAVVRGYAYPQGDGTARDLIRDPERDLFR